MNSQADIQDRIAAARKEAEGLKEKIKRKKEQLADTDCKSANACSIGTAWHTHAREKQTQLS